jgi:hypothetical protein
MAPVKQQLDLNSASVLMRGVYMIGGFLPEVFG